MEQQLQPGTKRCTRCGEVKPLDEGFYRNRRAADGRMHLCKDCSRQQGRQYVQANRDAVLERKRRYREAHREALREAGRRYLEANRDEINARKRGRSRKPSKKNPAARREADRRRMAKHPLYYTWKGMLKRCENPRDKDYPRYGGRGIKVCDEWHDYQAYAADILRVIGPRPESPPEWTSKWPYWSIDRIDNDGNYEPCNVQWQDPAGQARNQTRRIGKEHAEWVPSDEQMWCPVCGEECKSERAFDRHYGKYHRPS